MTAKGVIQSPHAFQKCLYLNTNGSSLCPVYARNLATSLSYLNFAILDGISESPLRVLAIEM